MNDITLTRCASLRIAAVLAHWVPGVGFRLSQPDSPDLRVASWDLDPDPSVIDIRPCEFRRVVIRHLGATDIGLATSNDSTVGGIEMVSAGRTRIGPLGIVRVELDDESGIVAFAEVSHFDGIDVPSFVGLDHDHDLDVTLAHIHFSLDDETCERQAFDVLVDLAASTTVARLDSLRC